MVGHSTTTVYVDLRLEYWSEMGIADIVSSARKPTILEEAVELDGFEIVDNVMTLILWEQLQRELL